MTKTIWIIIIVVVVAVVIGLVVYNNKKKKESTDTQTVVVEETKSGGKFIDFIGQLLPVALTEIQKNKAAKDAAALAKEKEDELNKQAFEKLLDLEIFGQKG